MESLGNLLPRALQKHVAGANQPVLEILNPLWPRMVGKYIGRFSRPAAFAAGTLTVAVSSPVWAAQLREMAPPICAQINGSLGAPIIKRLRIREEKPRAGEPSELDPPRVHRRPAAATATEARLRTELGERLWAESGVKLSPSLAETVERSFVKYFSRAEDTAKA